MIIKYYHPSYTRGRRADSAPLRTRFKGVDVWHMYTCIYIHIYLYLSIYIYIYIYIIFPYMYTKSGKVDQQRGRCMAFQSSRIGRWPGDSAPLRQRLPLCGPGSKPETPMGLLDFSFSSKGVAAVQN